MSAEQQRGCLGIYSECGMDGACFGNNPTKTERLKYGQVAYPVMARRKVVFKKCLEKETKRGTRYWWFNLFKEDWKWQVGFHRSEEETVLSLGVIRFAFRRRHE